MNKKQIALFSIVIVCFWGGLYVYVPTLSPYAESIGSTVVMMGFIGGIYGLVQFLLRIPIGIFFDMYNRRKLNVFLGMLFIMLSGICFLTIKTPWGVFLGRALAGIGASFWAVYTVIFHSYFKKSAQAIGILNACQMFGETFSSLFGGLLSQKISRGTPFIITIVLGCTGIAIAALLKESSVETDSFELKELLKIGKERSVLLLSVLGLVLQFISFGSAYVFTPLVAKSLGMGDAQLGVLTFLFALPAIGSALIIGTDVFRRIGYIKVLGFSFALMGISLIPIVYAKSVIILYIAQLCLGFGRGIGFTLLLLLVVKSVPEGKKATATSFYQAIYAIGMFMGPFFTGILSQDSSFVRAYIIMFLICLIAAGSIFVSEKKVRYE